VDAALGEELSAIPYSSSITVNLIYDEAKLGTAAGGIRLSGSGESKAARCWPARLSIASFWGARRRARRCCAPFWAA
jgi:hypothetical protein